MAEKVMADPVTHEKIFRELGNMEARFDSIVENQSRLERNSNAMAADIKSMRSTMDQIRGGRAALFGLLAVAGTLGAMITQAFHWAVP